MVKYICQNCDKGFEQKGHYDRHMVRKRPCKKDSVVEEKVNSILSTVPSGLFYLRPYLIVKEHVDTILNKDKSLFATSNDEPTPIGCVEEMMSFVPTKFWTRKGLSILDPCCGNGNFHLVIADKLRTSGYSPDELQESLQFNDINDARLQQVQAIFGINSNITQNDFLAIDDLNKYDMVVMNPPYAKLMKDGSRASKNHGLSVPFMRKGLQLLKPGGFLVAIVPDSWMSLADRNDFCAEITSYQFHALNIHCAKSWFPKVGSSFTWFVVEKVPATSPFQVSYLHKNKVYTDLVHSQTRAYIPLQYSYLIQSIFTKTIDNNEVPKYKVETSSNLHRYTQRESIRNEPDETFCHRLIHTPKQTVWANRPHKFQDGWKVFLSTTDKYNTFVDSCGMTQSIAFIRTKDEIEAKKISTLLMHPLYIFLNNACRYGNFNNIRILQHLPICSSENPFVEFGLTEEEIEFITSS